MQLRRIFSVIILCLLMQSCSSPKMSQELQLGKTLYAAGEYKPAFRQLLPLAADGKAEAQYAVGYMYYYGYGVAQDSESGLFWMTKSATQNYAPAIAALGMLDRREPLPSHSQPLYKGEEPPIRKSQNIAPHQPCIQPETTDRENDVLRTLPVRRSIPRENLSQATTRKPLLNTPAIPASSYALQLRGAYDLNVIKRLRDSLALDQTSQIWRMHQDGKDWYVLTYGKYHSITDATLALDRLPAKLQELGPWVRGTSGLEIISR